MCVDSCCAPRHHRRRRRRRLRLPSSHPSTHPPPGSGGRPARPQVDKGLGALHARAAAAASCSMHALTVGLGRGCLPHAPTFLHAAQALSPTHMPPVQVTFSRRRPRCKLVSSACWGRCCSSHSSCHQVWSARARATCAKPVFQQSPRAPWRVQPDDVCSAHCASGGCSVLSIGLAPKPPIPH